MHWIVNFRIRQKHRGVEIIKVFLWEVKRKKERDVATMIRSFKRKVLRIQFWWRHRMIPKLRAQRAALILQLQRLHLDMVTSENILRAQPYAALLTLGPDATRWHPQLLVHSALTAQDRVSGRAALLHWGINSFALTAAVGQARLLEPLVFGETVSSESQIVPPETDVHHDLRLDLSHCINRNKVQAWMGGTGWAGTTGLPFVPLSPAAAAAALKESQTALLNSTVLDAMPLLDAVAETVGLDDAERFQRIVGRLVPVPKKATLMRASAAQHLVRLHHESLSPVAREFRSTLERDDGMRTPAANAAAATATTPRPPTTPASSAGSRPTRTAAAGISTVAAAKSNTQQAPALAALNTSTPTVVVIGPVQPVPEPSALKTLTHPAMSPQAIKILPSAAVAGPIQPTPKALAFQTPALTGLSPQVPKALLMSTPTAAVPRVDGTVFSFGQSTAVAHSTAAPMLLGLSALAPSVLPLWRPLAKFGKFADAAAAGNSVATDELPFANPLNDVPMALWHKLALHIARVKRTLYVRQYHAWNQARQAYARVYERSAPAKLERAKVLLTQSLSAVHNMPPATAVYDMDHPRPRYSLLMSRVAGARVVKRALVEAKRLAVGVAVPTADAVMHRRHQPVYLYRITEHEVARNEQMVRGSTTMMNLLERRGSVVDSSLLQGVPPRVRRGTLVGGRRGSAMYTLPHATPLSHLTFAPGFACDPRPLVVGESRAPTAAMPHPFQAMPVLLYMLPLPKHLQPVVAKPTGPPRIHFDVSDDDLPTLPGDSAASSSTTAGHDETGHRVFLTQLKQ